MTCERGRQRLWPLIGAPFRVRVSTVGAASFIRESRRSRPCACGSARCHQFRNQPCLTEAPAMSNMFTKSALQKRWNEQVKQCHRNPWSPRKTGWVAHPRGVSSWRGEEGQLLLGDKRGHAGEVDASLPGCSGSAPTSPSIVSRPRQMTPPCPTAVSMFRRRAPPNSGTHALQLPVGLLELIVSFHVDSKNAARRASPGEMFYREDNATRKVKCATAKASWATS